MYKLKMWLNRNKFNILMSVVVSMFIYFSLKTIFPIPPYVLNNAGMIDYNLKIIQSFTIPLSGLAILIGFIGSSSSRKKSITLDKAKITMEFVEKYREFMKKMEPIEYIWSTYFVSEPTLSRIYKLSKSLDKVSFDQDEYIDILRKNNLEVAAVNAAFDVRNNNSILFYNACFHVFESGAFPSDHPIMDDLEKLFDNIKSHLDIVNSNRQKLDVLLDKVSKYDGTEDQSVIAKDSLETGELQEELVEMEKKLLNERLKVNGLIYFRTVDLFNDLECLCLNVKFGLISYEQIYNLVIVPFSSYIHLFYCYIMKAIISNNKDNYKVFSNIQKMYESLSDIRMNILNTDKRISKRKEKHIKNLLDGDSINY